VDGRREGGSQLVSTGDTRVCTLKKKIMIKHHIKKIQNKKNEYYLINFFF